MNIVERPKTALARNVRRLGHLDLAGAGQVTIAGNHAYVGHIPSASQLGTSIIDISDPRDAARGRHHHARRSGLPQPQGARRRRHHDRQPRAQHEQDRTACRAVAGGAARARRRAQARADVAGDRRQAERYRRRPARSRGVRAARLPQRRVQDLRRLQARAARSSSATRRPAASACTASTWTSATLTSRPRWTGYVGNILVIYDLSQSTRAAGSLTLVDARTAHRRRRDADLVGAAASPPSRAALRR